MQICPFSHTLESVSEAYFNGRERASLCTNTDLFPVAPPYTSHPINDISVHGKKQIFIIIIIKLIFCSQTAPLPARDTVPQQPAATESDGAFSTSPKTQKPPRTTRPSRNGAETGPLAWTRKRWGRKGAKAINSACFEARAAERATASTGSASRLHRLSLILCKIFPASSAAARDEIPLRTVTVLPRRDPWGAPPASPSLLGDGDTAMPKGGTGDSSSSSLLPPCASNKGASVPVPLPARQRPKRHHGTETPQGRAEGPGVTGRSPSAHILAPGQSPDGRNEQRVRGKIRSRCRR